MQFLGLCEVVSGFVSIGCDFTASKRTVHTQYALEIDSRICSKKLPARPRCMGSAESGAYAWTNATSLHSSLVTGKVSGKVFAEHFNENDTGWIQ